MIIFKITSTNSWINKPLEIFLLQVPYRPSMLTICVLSIAAVNGETQFRSNYWPNLIEPWYSPPPQHFLSVWPWSITYYIILIVIYDIYTTKSVQGFFSWKRWEHLVVYSFNAKTFTFGNVHCPICFEYPLIN